MILEICSKQNLHQNEIIQDVYIFIEYFLKMGINASAAKGVFLAGFQAGNPIRFLAQVAGTDEGI